MIKCDLMIKPKVFIYILFLVISTNVLAQTNIDSVDFIIVYPESYLKPHAVARFYQGVDTLDQFTLEDTLDCDFSWSGDITPDIDTLHFGIYDFGVAGNYTISLSVYEKATATTFNFSRNVIVSLPTVLNVPNVFSPNNDGINDFFKVFYDGTTILEITIFTRTGTQVFESESPSIVWDGRNNSGSEMSEGVYYYVLKSAVLKEDQTGFIHLYRSK